MEPKWTPDIKAALAPFLFGDGEDERAYFEALAGYANLRMPTRLDEWRSVKSSFERERAAARAYRSELAGNGGKCDARAAYEAAAARGDKNAVWFD